MNIKPTFDFDADMFKEHLNTLTNELESNKTVGILDKLLLEIIPVNFENIINQNLISIDQSQSKEETKVTEKHYLIIVIEELLKIAQNNSWGLCKNNDFIYLYNGKFWSEIDKNTFQSFLANVALKMKVPQYTAKYYRFNEHLFKQFLNVANLTPPQVSNDIVHINLKNGTFEITTQGNNLRPFDKNDFITYQLPFKYDIQANAPIFEKYLNKVLPDIEAQNVLAEYLGYVFIKNGNQSIKEEKVLILYGTGANGKSVFFEVVNALLGEQNISNYTLQSLTDEKGYHRAKISNKLVNYASEISSKLETTIFKQLVSGEQVEARLPYGQPFIMKQYAKLIFNCNELPRDVEHNTAYFRRFLIIPFEVTIPPDEQDKTLHTKIIENELTGVFNWVLKGLDRLLQNKKIL